MRAYFKRGLMGCGQLCGSVGERPWADVAGFPLRREMGRYKLSQWWYMDCRGPNAILRAKERRIPSIEKQAGWPSPTLPFPCIPTPSRSVAIPCAVV
jgi:hypothetical protein